MPSFRTPRSFLPGVVRGLLCLLTALLMSPLAFADEAQIRKNVAERFPKLPPIDEVTATPIPGIYEVRLGSEIFYVDEEANHLIEGSLMDTRSRTNLTENRLAELSKIDYGQLPFKDAVVWKAGSGVRRMAVFADPNCGYCKQLEADLRKLKNVTIYTFLVPVLGPDSAAKSRDIWCASDRTKAWLGWMLEGVTPQKPATACNTSAIDRNVALSRKHRVNGTPTLVFANNERVSGVIGVGDIEKLLQGGKLDR